MRTETENFSEDTVRDVLIPKLDVTYRRVPHEDVEDGIGGAPIWRVAFELVSSPGVCLGLEINGEVLMGRGDNGTGHIDLTPYDTEPWSVSRRHLMLRPTDTNLFISDMGSTNGTLHNGRPIGVHTPYSLSNGDLLSVGRLEFVTKIVKRPKGHTALLQDKASLSDALIEMARAVTSQRELDDVLNQALQLARSLTTADETAIWLVDERSNELILKQKRACRENTS